MDTEVIAMILSFSLLINLLVLILRNYFLVVMQQSIITLFSIIIIIKFPIDSPTIKFLTKFVINSYLTIFINFDFIIPNIKPLSKNIMTEIYLNCKKIKDHDIKKLIPKNVQNYTYLKLGYNQLTATGIRFLGDRNWSNLTYLNLKNNKLGNHGVKHLAKLVFPNLKTLNIGSNNIDDLGIKYFVKGDFNSLETLILYENNFNHGTGALIRGKLNNLRQIWFNFDQNFKVKLFIKVWITMLESEWKLNELYFPMTYLTSYEMQMVKTTAMGKYGQCDVHLW